jgi:hypothetical protein
MGLVLQYIITVIHGASDSISNDAVIAEQKILGFVARAIHDFPVITEATRVPGTPTPVLHPDIAAQKNQIRLNLRPATREESVGFWSSSDDKLPRLSLFVEARVAILEPRRPTVLPGIVLSVGNFIFPGGGPQLTLTRSELRFLAPVIDTGTTELHQITASPARATLLPIPLPGPPDPVADPIDRLDAIHPDLDLNNIVSIEAVNIRPGRRFLMLRGPDGVEIKVDMDSATDNPDWEFMVQSNLVQFRLRRTVVGLVAGSIQTVTLDFGVYTARVLVESPNFGNKPQSSNEVPFTAIPQITEIVTVDLDPGAPVVVGYNLRITGNYFATASPPLITEQDIVLAVQGVTLVPRPASTPALNLNPGEFKIDTTTEGTPTSLLLLRLPDPFPTPSPTNPLPVSLLIKGAPATPAWITDATP